MCARQHSAAMHGNSHGMARQRTCFAGRIGRWPIMAVCATLAALTAYPALMGFLPE